MSPSSHSTAMTPCTPSSQIKTTTEVGLCRMETKSGSPLVKKFTLQVDNLGKLTIPFTRRAMLLDGKLCGNSLKQIPALTML